MIKVHNEVEHVSPAARIGSSGCNKLSCLNENKIAQILGAAAPIAPGSGGVTRAAVAAAVVTTFA
jgi:hypothetical protein